MKADGSKLPLQQDNRPVFASPDDYESMVDQLKRTPGRICIDAAGSNSLDQYGVSLPESETRSASPQSSERQVSRVRELQLQKYKDHVSDTAHLPNNKDIQHSRRGLWPHLYQLSGNGKLKGGLGDPLLKAKDKLMGSVRETSRKADVNTWHVRHLKSKHIEERGRVRIDATDVKNSDNESALLPQDARMKILSTSSFSQFFGKKTSKGKGVMYSSHIEDKTQHDNDGALQSDERLASSVGTASDVQEKPFQLNSCGVVLDPNCVGVNFREWLSPGNMKNKVERLKVFCQIVEMVGFAHSQGVVLQQLRPSYFILMASKKLKYMGKSSRTDVDVSVSMARGKKRPWEENVIELCTSNVKQPKLITDMKFPNHLSSTTLIGGSRTATFQDNSYNVGCSSGSDNTEHRVLSTVSCQTTILEKSLEASLKLEEKWYTCPQDLDENVSSFSSNIYSLGMLLFELLCTFDKLDAHSAAMFDMHHRILPPHILSESPKEAGFCLWLMHPDPSSRPTIREVLLSDLFQGFQESQPCDDDSIVSANDDEVVESELLLDFLVSSNDKKQSHAAKLLGDISCIEADIKGLEAKTLSSASHAHTKRDSDHQGLTKIVARSGGNVGRLRTDMSQLEKAYFSMRSQTTTTDGRADKDLLKVRESSSQGLSQSEIVNMKQKSGGGLDVFFESLRKFSRFSKFELRGTLRNGDLLNPANVICSLGFDRDEEYIAVAGASKTIKIFEFASLLNDSINIHYPVIEVGNKSKFSCVSWNSYIKNYLASTDYDGVVQVWDASTGVGFSQHLEHQRRAWSVDFSRVDPTKFATGSDDCSVKLWCTNEKKSTSTIWNPANVCCVQYSPYSSHLLAFGSADHKIYGYDLRYTRIPWCSLSGHEKTVSYVKFVDSETLVSASTDNTLKIWDLSKTSMSGLSSDACHLTLSGHTNTKHFVGLSAQDGYIACGSESNEVFSYYKSLPMPIASYKFIPVSPTSQHEVEEDSGQFVSSVCWRSKSNMVLAANSGGSIRLLQMV